MMYAAPPSGHAQTSRNTRKSSGSQSARIVSASGHVSREGARAARARMHAGPRTRAASLSVRSGVKLFVPTA